MFWNTRCIYNTKVRAFNRRVVLVVPWSWFTDIVRTCPDKLTSITSIVTVKSPWSGCSFTPTNTVVSIIWLFVMTFRTVTMFQFTFRAIIATTCTSSWRCFWSINQPIRMFCAKGLVIIFRIVKSNRIQFISNFLMPSATITETELICSHGNITSLINILDNLDQTFNSR